MLSIINRLLLILRILRALSKRQKILFSIAPMAILAGTAALATIWPSSSNLPHTTNSATRIAVASQKDAGALFEATPQQPATSAAAPSALPTGYEVILNTDTIAKAPNQRSSLITARTSDNRTVVWSLDAGRSGLIADFDANQAGKPSASFSFWIDGSITSPDDTATVQIIASFSIPDTGGTEYARKTLTVKTDSAPSPVPTSFNLKFDDVTHFYYDGDQPVWEAHFFVSRQNGHTGTLSGSATLNGCPASVYHLPITFSGDYGYIATRSNTPITEYAECTVHATVTGSGYTASSSGTLTYDPVDY